jgi:RIO kinase 1
VLAVVKGGKEASVYRCQALPHTGETLLAAKVYRPHQFRQIRNDAIYREGRGLLSSGGADLNQTVHGDRLRRAVGKKTAFGRQVSHTSWLMHEFKTLDSLYRAGAAVPRPIAASDNAILMTYCGDASTAAPLLSEVDLDADEITPLFDEVMRNVELMLQHGLIHGDLSAYNILYWEGQITLIDFPQVVDAHANSQARFILERDLERVCDYFADQGLERDPEAIQRRLWKQYLAPNPREQAADLSRLLESEGEAE